MMIQVSLPSAILSEFGGWCRPGWLRQKCGKNKGPNNAGQFSLAPVFGEFALAQPATRVASHTSFDGVGAECQIAPSVWASTGI